MLEAIDKMFQFNQNRRIDMTFQSTFVSNKFIFGPSRSRMRAPHPSRGSPTGDVWMDIPQGTWTVL
jgi:hypothetical protein